MEDEALGPSLGDYFRGARRQRKGLIVGGLFGALLLTAVNLLTGGLGSRYRVVAEMRGVDERAVAQAFLLPPELVATRTLTADSLRLGSAVRNDLKGRLPTGSVLVVKGDDAAGLLTVIALAPDRGRAESAAQLAAAWMVDLRRAETGARLTSVKGFATRRLGELRDRMTSVDAQLSAASDEAARRNLEIERITVVDEQLTTQRTLLGVDQLAATNNGGLTAPLVVAGSSVGLSAGWLQSATVGLVLGLLLGLAWSVLRTFLDRRLWSAAMVLRLVPHGVSAVVLPEADGSIRRTLVDAFVRDMSARIDGPTRLVIAGADDSAQGDGVRAEMEMARQALGSDLRIVGVGDGRGSDLSMVGSIAADDQVAVITTYGATSEDALAASSSAVRTAGAHLAAVVLVGVPARELGAALREGRSARGV